jgi:DNA-binding NarL/FixJ family response regulator
MRLYRVETECRKCEHRYRDWITEAQRKAAFKIQADEILAVHVCPRFRCGNDIPVLASHVRDASFDRLRTMEVARNPLLRNMRLEAEEAPSRLTEKQAQICALVMDGLSDRKIAARLRMEKPTVRHHLQIAARALCAEEPVACRVFPRQTIVAYYQTRAGSTEPAALFQLAG